MKDDTPERHPLDAVPRARKRSRKSAGKRAYTLSPKARAQRRAAAWKHGQRAESAVAQVVPPCKPALCPIEGEHHGHCAMKRELEESGKVVDRCVVAFVGDPELRRRYRDAIVHGKLEDLAEGTADLLAGLHELGADQLVKLKAEGFVTEFDVYGPNGEQSTGVKVNPRAEPTLKTLELLGATGPQQAITPKSAGERKRDESAGDLVAMFRRRSMIAGLTAKPVGPARTAGN